MQEENDMMKQHEIKEKSEEVNMQSEEKAAQENQEGTEGAAAPAAIGGKIAYLRRQEGMTQAQLAEMLNISAQAVSKWESGLSCPDIMMLIPLSRIFRVTTDMLLDTRPIEELLAQRASVNKGNNIYEKPDNESDEGASQNQTSEIERDNWLITVSKVSEINSLKIDLETIEARIVEGDDFSVSGLGVGRDEIVSTVENGIWTLKTPNHATVLWGFKRLFRDRKLIITFPKGFIFRALGLSLGVGSLYGEGLSAKRCVFNVGVGGMRLKSCILGEVKAECGVGSIQAEGSVSGLCRLECGMGEISMKLKEPFDYGYKASVGLGQITIGTQMISGSGKQKFNTKASNFFDISCGMGNVKVDFY